MMTPMVCHTASSLEDLPVTDGSPPPVDFLLPVCELCVIGVTLTGSTTDSPLGGAAIKAWETEGSDNTRNHHCSVRSSSTGLLNPVRLCAGSYTQLVVFFTATEQHKHTHTHTCKCSHL